MAARINLERCTYGPGVPNVGLFYTPPGLRRWVQRPRSALIVKGDGSRCYSLHYLVQSRVISCKPPCFLCANLGELKPY